MVTITEIVGRVFRHKMWQWICRSNGETVTNQSLLQNNGGTINICTTCTHTVRTLMYMYMYSAVYVKRMDYAYTIHGTLIFLFIPFLCYISHSLLVISALVVSKMKTIISIMLSMSPDTLTSPLPLDGTLTWWSIDYWLQHWTKGHWLHRCLKMSMIRLNNAIRRGGMPRL